MKKISVVLMALVALFVLACSKGSVADQTVKMLNEAVEKIQKCENLEDVKVIIQDVQEFLTSNKEELEKIDENNPESEKLTEAMTGFLSVLAEKNVLGEFVDFAKQQMADEAAQEAEESAQEALEDAAEDIADAAKDAAEDIADAAKEATDKIADAVKE